MCDAENQQICYLRALGSARKGLSVINLVLDAAEEASAEFRCGAWIARYPRRPEDLIECLLDAGLVKLTATGEFKITDSGQGHLENLEDKIACNRPVCLL